MGLITSVSSTSHGNSWYSPSKGQMDDGWPNTLVHTMINHFNTVNTALGPLCFKVDESQVKELQCSQMRCGQKISAVPHSLISLNLGAFSKVPLAIFDFYLLTTWLKQLWGKSGIYFQANVQCGLESQVAVEIWFNNRFGLPLAQIIRQSLLLGPGEVMRTPLTPGQQPVQ